MDNAILNSMRANIAQAKSKLEDMRKELDKAKNAGLDVSKAESDYINLRSQIAKLQAVYGS